MTNGRGVICLLKQADSRALQQCRMVRRLGAFQIGIVGKPEIAFPWDARLTVPYILISELYLLGHTINLVASGKLMLKHNHAFISIGRMEKPRSNLRAIKR